MIPFETFNISKQLRNGLEDLGFTTPTPIQEESFSVILSGKDVVGISQTGTGKTLAYMLPLLQGLKYSAQINPRVIVLVPTRELVVQVVDQIKSYAKYQTVRVVGVFGGVNINTQKMNVLEGADIIVGTPGRFYDLVLSRAIQLKSVNKLVIDEVDIMLDLGFRFQLQNIFELMGERRQNIMFSATMTEEVDALIDDYFTVPKRIAVALSGTPLANIEQTCYPVENFYTKVNLLEHLLADRDELRKVLVFVGSKKHADRLYVLLAEKYDKELGIIHSNKAQNNRLKTVEGFDAGRVRILISTDVMARGLDVSQITHVFNFDVPMYAENYMHRIGRTGRAERMGKSVLLYTEKEDERKLAIEVLMNYSIPMAEFPDEVEISTDLLPEEQPDVSGKNPFRKMVIEYKGEESHEKLAKNVKENVRVSHKQKMQVKYKKAKTRGDKKVNRKKK